MRATVPRPGIRKPCAGSRRWRPSTGSCLGPRRRDASSASAASPAAEQPCSSAPSPSSAGTFLMPFTLPPLVLGLIGLELGIGILPLMRNLVLFIGGAALVAATLRHFAGAERLRRHAVELSGLSMLVLILFAIAIMDGVRDLIVARPQQVSATRSARFSPACCCRRSASLPSPGRRGFPPS